MQIRMGAAAYVGRIGALAVALGIGAAVFTGQAVASAEPSTSGTGSTSGDSSGSAEPSSASSGTSAGSSDAKPGAEKRSRTHDHGAPARLDTSDEHTATTPVTTSKRDTVRFAARSSKTTPPETPGEATDPNGHRSAATTSLSPSSSAVAAEVTTPQTPPAPTNTTSLDVAPVGTSSVVGPLVDSINGDTPVAPADPPVAWTLLAAARRESYGAAPALANTVPPVTTGPAVAGVTAPAAATLTAPAVPTPVLAIPQIAPLQGLQRLPVIGPLLLTPILTIIHQIPLIGDVLHPFIGYPLQTGLPAGTPLPRDVKVVSFDGTQIYVHYFPAAGLQAGQKAPTILDGPGLALPGSTSYLTNQDEFLPNDVIGIWVLRRAGYNVLTWDPRGEWNSGGPLEIDSPDFEARDVSAIISWIATQPDAQLDPGVLDPRIGMVGASYGGGIQLVAAAIDHRIDAIVPTIAWNSLNTSLDKNGAFKSSWGTLLTAALIGTLARSNPQLYPAAIYGDLTGMLTPSDEALLAARGPSELVDQITAPTLLIQGTVDTLFTLAEADANAKVLLANGVETKVIWYCGGHGSCVSSVNDGVLVRQRTLDWLAHYVVGTTSVNTGPQFEWVDQHGTQFSSDTYPVPKGPPIVATSAGGVLPLVPVIGGSGPQLGVLLTGPIGALLGLPSGAKAANALDLATPVATETTYIVGAPTLTFTYSGIGTSRDVYAQLVDDTTGLVLGNLVTPVPVTLDGKSRVAKVDMEEVAQTLRPGETVTLQLVASAVPYETANSFGVLEVSSLQLTLPTADPAAVSVGGRPPLSSTVA